MKINEIAKKNFSELFPDQNSTLENTDPDFVEINRNFTFDEVLQHVKLDSKTGTKVILSSLIAMNTMTEYNAVLVSALHIGITPIEIKELVYHAVPYVGFARAWDAVLATNAVFKEKNIATPLESQSTTTAETRFEKGLEVQKAIFGEGVTKALEESPENQNHMRKFLADNCFGDYYTRNGIDVKTRELLTFSMLVSLGRCEPQVKAHVRGNSNVGNGKDVLLSVVTQLLPYIGYPRTLNAITSINEILPEN